MSIASNPHIQSRISGHHLFYNGYAIRRASIDIPNEEQQCIHKVNIYNCSDSGLFSCVWYQNRLEIWNSKKCGCLRFWNLYAVNRDAQKSENLFKQPVASQQIYMQSSRTKVKIIIFTLMKQS